MPFSSNSGKNFLIKFFNNICDYYPELVCPDIGEEVSSYKIHDFGCGSGTYSKLFKKQLKDLHKDVNFDGIEIHKPYISKYNLSELYDNVDNLSIRDFFDKLLESDNKDYYSCAIFGDVIEHLELDDAIEIHQNALHLYGFTIISIPLGYYPQDEYDGNIHEKHITNNWTHEKVLETFDHCVSYHIENEIGIYIFSEQRGITNLIKKCLEPKIGVYIICKNEQQFIERCLKSARNADEIVLVDTGSTDSTLSIANFLKNNSSGFDKLKIFQASIKPWRFDEAKNVALMLLNENLDLAISLDADEMLDLGWKEFLIANYDKNITRYNHKFETIWNWETPEEKAVKTEHWHDRIHNRHGYLWKLPVHEILMYKDQEKIKFCDNVKIIQKPDQTKSRSNYLPLLQISVKENPNIWKSWFFLSQELININDINEALICIDKALELSDSDKSFLYYSKAKIYEKFTFDKNIDNINKAKYCFEKSCESNEIKEYFVYASIFCNSNNFIKEAKYYAKKAMECVSITNGYAYNSWCWSVECEEFLNSI